MKNSNFCLLTLVLLRASRSRYCRLRTLRLGDHVQLLVGCCVHALDDMMLLHRISYKVVVKILSIFVKQPHLHLS